MEFSFISWRYGQRQTLVTLGALTEEIHRTDFLVHMFNSQGRIGLVSLARTMVVHLVWDIMLCRLVE